MNSKAKIWPIRGSFKEPGITSIVQIRSEAGPNHLRVDTIKLDTLNMVSSMSYSNPRALEWYHHVETRSDKACVEESHIEQR